MNRKIIWVIGIIILTLIFTALILNDFLFTGRIIEEQEFHSSTIAICNETENGNIYCEDYEIECEGNKTSKISATGYAIQRDKDWEDPRGEQKENLCE